MHNIKLNYQNQPLKKPTKTEIKILKILLKLSSGKIDKYFKAPIDQISSISSTDRFYVSRIIKKLESRGALTRKGHRLMIHYKARETLTTTMFHKSCNFTKKNPKKLQLSNNDAIININHVYKYTNQVFSYKKNQSCEPRKTKNGPTGRTDFNFYLKNNWNIGLKYISAVADTAKIKDLEAYNASVLRNWYKSPETKNKALLKMNTIESNKKQIAQEQKEKELKLEKSRQQQKEIKVQVNIRRQKLDHLKEIGQYEALKKLSIQQLTEEMKTPERLIPAMVIDSRVFDLAFPKIILSN